MGYKLDNNVEIFVKLLCLVVVMLCSILVKWDGVIGIDDLILGRGVGNFLLDW